MKGINKKELKKIDCEFRKDASRLIQTHPSDAKVSLKIFIDFIDETPLIIDYIKSINVEEIDVERMITPVINRQTRRPFHLGSTPQEEIVWSYQLLKYIVTNQIDVITVTEPYGSYTEPQQRIKNFGSRVVLPFVSHIQTYFTNIGIDMGVDEEISYQITVHGGQVNLAQDHATINATQNNGIDLEKLDKLIERITVLMPAGLQPDDKEVICESVEVIQDELKKEHPKKGLIKTAIRGLGMVAPAIAGTVDFAAAVSDLVQFAQPFLQ